MDDKLHLPAAAALPSADALAALDATSIYAMAEECSRWLRNAAECRSLLITPVARTLWMALAQGEVDHVAKTYDQLMAEIERRAFPTAGEAKSSPT